ncbi:hypothetical protein L1F30_00680 [Simiduia sp. 21SJ11W-1]|uniref:hypothetical protein n=1 Tax=Simiduia sp. 21SJ11W-1 TaxID=2909669 RepID=UPI00209EC83D|nr:hypothetical protein [Simiduia sp. 21SJ11W-1]UTA48070.1 hypothetical protein L1F30_00680 [Simiduia sp. 21SJ11W-1]
MASKSPIKKQTKKSKVVDEPLEQEDVMDAAADSDDDDEDDTRSSAAASFDSDDDDDSAASDDHLVDYSVRSREATRAALNAQIEEFLARGGKINHVDNNVTADPPKKPTSNYGSRPI